MSKEIDTTDLNNNELKSLFLRVMFESWSHFDKPDELMLGHINYKNGERFLIPLVRLRSIGSKEFGFFFEWRKFKTRDNSRGEAYCWECVRCI